ncbi:MAG TPA: UDP-glucose--hexose-1-phosphate uridylyltransferase [Candidatus Acidoferrales bacterium]|nr:UDP-glucose--hexose-1-phosphate uridylyltransferase [Candidatus Acidoferrales bacterium]
MTPEFTLSPHRRRNPLTGEWVLVSPHRTYRPWQGQVEKAPTAVQTAYDPQCYLCPGNARANGEVNPAYTSTFVFTNDYAALKPDNAATRLDVCGKGLMVAETENGICRVMCFSPRHDLTLGAMSVPEIETVVGVWAEQYLELGALPRIRHVQIFENRGEIMGCSNPHPHCQIWANQTIPNEPLKEQHSQIDYLRRHSSCLLCDYVALEFESGERVVAENAGFVAVVPFWAVWPFEVLLVSRQHVRDLAALSTESRSLLADILQRVASAYDKVFDVTFPYSMGFHQAPTDGEPHEEWHMHAHFYPPLLRSATVRKFMVGYEMLAAPQRDLTPESAAQLLRTRAVPAK